MLKEVFFVNCKVTTLDQQKYCFEEAGEEQTVSLQSSQDLTQNALFRISINALLRVSIGIVKEN